MKRHPVQAHPGYASAAEWWTGILARLFPLPDLADFPPVSTWPSDDELDIIGRFTSQAGRLVESEGLNAPSGMRVSIKRREDNTWEEEVDANFPSYEATTGLAGLFRQLYSQEERASFYRVMTILQRLSRDGSRDEARRLEALAVWGKAVSSLRSKGVERLASEALGFPGIEGDQTSTPERIISLFLNAEHLHWDKNKSAEVSSWSSSAVLSAHFRYKFHEAVAPLAHLFIMFAVFVAGVLERSKPRGA